MTNNIYFFRFKGLILFIGLLFFAILNSNYITAETYRIYLIDKGQEEFTEGTQIYNETYKLYTQKALERREKVNRPLTINDAVLFQPYIDEIIEIGGEVRAKLRFNNYLVAELDSIGASKLDDLEFIKAYTVTESNLLPLSINNKDNVLKTTNYTEFLMENTFEYGKSEDHIKMLNIHRLHEYGINGENILFGLVDTGFKWKHTKFLNNINVIEEYDFVNQDTVTSNQEGDLDNHDNHGTNVLSIIATNQNNEYMGVASGSEFILAKSEDLSSETKIEEDLYAMAFEYLEAKGVDIINSSLGYRHFDNDIKYDFSDLDGNTTICADIVNKCVDRGVHVVVSAGNSGNQDSSIVSPADADSVIAVGALKINGRDIAGYSSFGPNAKGKIKPDLVAMGSLVPVLNNSNTFAQGNGTSLAAPIIAGASGLLLSLYPELTPFQIRDILKKSSDYYDNPNNQFGYGKPDMLEAIKDKLGISPISHFIFDNHIRIVTYILEEPENIDNAELHIKFYNSAKFEQYSLNQSIIKYLYFIDIPLMKFEENTAEAFIEVSNSKLKRRTPYNEDNYYVITPQSDFFKPGMNIEHLITSVEEDNNNNYQNKINYRQSGNYIKFIMQNVQSGTLNINIYDLNGILLSKNNNNISNHTFYEKNINISKFSSGIYLIEIQIGNIKEIKKIIINK